MNRPPPSRPLVDVEVPLDLLDDFGPFEETGVELVEGERALEALQKTRTLTSPGLPEPRAPEDVVGLRIVRPEEWCRVCGSRHEMGECPGELLASGPERYGWRATYETPRGTRETHAVLIAPASGRWRARIMTYPRALWTLPGCPRTIKFLADLPGTAEKLARELVEAHCRDRDCKRLVEESSKLEASSFEREEIDARFAEAVRRRPRVLPVKFGLPGQPLVKSSTADLSEAGLFIVTDATFALGAILRIMLELPGASLPLRGSVRWVRRLASPGRPVGVGLELHRAPALYLSYVRALP